MIAYLLVALGLVGMVSAGYVHVLNTGKDKIRAEYAPLIKMCDEFKWKADTCAKDWTGARDAKAELERQLTDARAAGKQCSDATDASRREADEREKEKKKLQTASKGKLDQLRAERDAALEAAKKGAAGGTCEGRLSRITNSLDELAARELLFRPPDPAPAAGEGRNSKGSGTNTLRIR